jgi:carboxyl-terminal processing protease
MDGRLEQVELDRAIVDGMARSVQSRSTLYRQPGAAAMGQSQSQYTGIGVAFAPGFIVREVFDGSPAAHSDLRLGDTVNTVNGQSIDGLTMPAAQELVRGPAGSSVELGIGRSGSPEPLSITLNRGEVAVNWLTHRVLDGNVGYLRIRSFPEADAIGRFAAALAELEDAGVTGLIIDLRATTCCFFASVSQIASQLVKEGPLYQLVDRAGQARTVVASGGYWGREIPYTVLVDGTTQSNGEMLASALRELTGARIVGTQTGGFTMSAQQFPLHDGSTLQVTVSIVRSGRGAALNGVGLEPDVVVQLDLGELALGQDSQLASALGTLRP